MKTILRFSYALMVAMMSMFVAACGSDDDGNGTPNVPTQPETPSLSVPVKSYNVAQSGETLKVTLSTNQTGVSVDVAADSKSWIHPSAINTQSFSLTVDKSDEYDTRTGSVTVKAGTLSETITITQQGSVVLTLAKTEYTISDAGGDILIDTESNFKYEVKTNVDWIKEVSNTSRAISKSTITLNVQPNGNYDSRQAVIVLRDPSSQMEKTVTIIQAQKNAIVLSKDSYEFDKVGGKIDVEVASNVEYETKIDCNWITQVSSRALTSKQLSFNVTAMPDGKLERNTTISFKNQETGIEQYITVKQTNNSIGVEAVDIGLSVKWANMNVGANKPEEYGDYFAWGETIAKSTYNWSTYKWCNGSGQTLTKYYKNDNKTMLDFTDDAARENWGGLWRMPTYAEVDELLNNCNWTWKILNDVNGYQITGPNGNSIFLPAAGIWRDSYKPHSRETIGCYWSLAFLNNWAERACYLDFNSGHVAWERGYRSYGLTVRAVYP